MNKIIIGIAITLVAFVGIVWLAQPASHPNKTNSSAAVSDLSADSPAFDFGSISMAAGVVKHNFTIQNRGAEPITVKEIYTSCMCTTAALMMNGPSTSSGQVKQFGPYGMPGHGFTPKVNATINPGEEATVEVVFDPAAHGPAGVGPVVRAVYLETDNKEVLELRLSATVTP